MEGSISYQTNKPDYHTSGSLFFKNVYWGIADLQGCVSFRCTAKWFGYTYTYIHSFSDSFLIWVSQNTEYSSLCCKVCPCWLSDLFIVLQSLVHVQLVATLDSSPPDSTVYGAFQARILKWVAISCSKCSSLPRDWTYASCIAGGCFTCWAIGRLIYVNLCMFTLNPDLCTSSFPRR